MTATARSSRPPRTRPSRSPSSPQEFDLTPRAIRFYEDVGLLEPERAGAQPRLHAARPHAAEAHAARQAAGPDAGGGQAAGRHVRVAGRHRAAAEGLPARAAASTGGSSSSSSTTSRSRWPRSASTRSAARGCWPRPPAPPSAAPRRRGNDAFGRVLNDAAELRATAGPRLRAARARLVRAPGR